MHDIHGFMDMVSFLYSKAKDNEEEQAQLTEVVRDVFNRWVRAYLAEHPTEQEIAARRPDAKAIREALYADENNPLLEKNGGPPSAVYPTPEPRTEPVQGPTFSMPAPESFPVGGGAIVDEEMSAGPDIQSVMAGLQAQRAQAAAAPPQQAFDTKICPNFLGYGVRKTHLQATLPHQYATAGKYFQNEQGGFFSCSDRECLSPFGKHTTWDVGNYAERVDLFVSGPKRRTGGGQRR